MQMGYAFSLRSFLASDNLNSGYRWPALRAESLCFEFVCEFKRRLLTDMQCMSHIREHAYAVVRSLGMQADTLTIQIMWTAHKMEWLGGRLVTASARANERSDFHVVLHMQQQQAERRITVAKNKIVGNFYHTTNYFEGT